MSTTEPLPCPFCGRPPVVVDVGDGFELYHAAHDSREGLGCIMERIPTPLAISSGREAIGYTWNKRAPVTEGVWEGSDRLWGVVRTLSKSMPLVADELRRVAGSIDLLARRSEPAEEACRNLLRVALAADGGAAQVAAATRQAEIWLGRGGPLTPPGISSKKD